MVHPSRCSKVVTMVSLGLALLCSTVQAQSFSNPKNVSNNSDFSMTPQVAVDASGNIYTAWEDDTANNSNILFSRSMDGGMTFSSPKNLSNSPSFSSNPHIAVDSQGISVVWQDDSPGVFFSRSTDGGVTFSAPMNLSNNPGGSSNPQIGVDGSGNISVVWENDGGTLGIFFSHSIDGGNTFSAPVNLATNTTGSLTPQMAIGVDGSINVAWEDDFNFQSDISFSRSTNKGATFSTPKNVSNNSGNSFSVQIAVDLSGNINLAWMDDTPGNFDILFSRSTDQGNSFSPAKNVSNSPGDSSNPLIGVDGSGNIFVAWQDNVPPAFNRDIYFARSTDGGATFPTVLNLSNNSGNSINPSMTVDAAGGINLGWQDNTPGTANIFFTRSTDSGVTFSATQSLSNDSASSSDVQIAADLSGNLDVVWSDTFPGVNQIFFSRFSSPVKQNQPPVANAGQDQTLQCAGPGGTAATLTGSATDPDGDALSFVWTDELGKVVGNAAVASVTVGMGTHAYTLTVTDAGGLTSAAKTHVTVIDTTPPTLQVSLSPNALFPANHKLVQVTAQIQISDVCDASPKVQLVSITANGADSGDIQAVGGGPIPFGTDVRSFLLRAERSGTANRVYNVTYMATDASGNATMVTVTVTAGKDSGWYGPGAPAPAPKGKGKDKDKDKDKDKGKSTDKDKDDHDHH